ncbi:FUN14 domain-containing protein [Halobacteria archaeon AArc-dxtr1]|nr:FUN14 domain-containing protein [Halobacteria archaeon AArc-dxtr1]
MSSIEPTMLGFEFAASMVLGAIIGYGTKRIAKVLAVVIGVQLVVFRYLESQGIVVVHWDRLTAGLAGAQEDVEQAGTDWLDTAVTTLSVGVGFTAGFLIGYHRG